MKRLIERLQPILKELRNYRFSSMFIRTLVLIVAAIALPLTAALVTIYSYSQSLLSREVEIANQRSLQLTLNVVDMFTEEATTVAQRLSVDSTLQSVLRQGMPQSISEYTLVNNLASSLELNRKYALIDSILLYNPAAQYVVGTSAGASRLAFSLDPSMRSTYENMSDATSLWVRRKVPVLDIASNGVWGITLYHRFNFKDCSGLLAINIRDEQLSKLLSNGSNSVVLINSDGSVLYDQSGRYSGGSAAQMLGEKAALLNAGRQGILDIVIDGERKMLTFEHTGNTGWVCASITPYHTYTQRFDALRAFLAVSLIVAALLALLLAFLLAMRLYRPIQAILSFIQSPQTVLGGQHVPINGELSAILMHLVSVYDKNRQLEQELLKRYSILRNAQVRSLKAQVTPHFLHNTLQAVQWQLLRETGRMDSPACRALVALSEMARQSMDDSSPLSALGDELDYVEKFMQLQHLRYGDGLCYCCEVPDDLRDIAVPRMGIQPLVENAVEHGLGHRHGQGIIRVSARRMDSDLLLEVSDNGKGMDKTTMESYNNAFTSEGKPLATHIGLSNLNQRVRLLCGEGYGLRLSPSPQGGLTVSMRVPFALYGLTPQ